MDQTEIATLVSVIILLTLVIVIISLTMIYVKRKNHLIVEQQRLRTRFNRELTRAKIEIREETLKNISWELHDNIGQLMTLAKIQTQNAVDDPSRMEEAIQSQEVALNELRSLSRMINSDVLIDMDLVRAVELELERFNRLNVIKTSLTLQGQRFDIQKANDIIVFRILQELFNNILKHAKASKMRVVFKYTNQKIDILVEDDGVGFQKEMIKDGSGLRNIRQRAALIDASFSIESDNQATRAHLSIMNT